MTGTSGRPWRTTSATCIACSTSNRRLPIRDGARRVPRPTTRAMSLPAFELPAVDRTSPAQCEQARPLALRAPFIAAALALVAGFVVVNTLPIGGFYDDAFYVI